MGYETMYGGIHPIKMWTNGVPVEGSAREQLRKIALMPFIHKHIAVMPDVHLGKGATVGSVIPTVGAIIPAAVGVDIGCGMMAVRTSLEAEDLPDNLDGVRLDIEKAVPHGRTANGGPSDRGAWSSLPKLHEKTWADDLALGFKHICAKYPKIEKGNTENHLGTLGTGNHFIELCLDEEQRVWIMLHSGSRGVGNRIGQFFISRAQREMEKAGVRLPDKDLAYLREGTKSFDDYVEAVGWAQKFARENRRLMMHRAVDAMRKNSELPPFTAKTEAVECHHNYVAFERHDDTDVIVTRKGAVHAGHGVMGIIPGSMGAKSFIVRGKGNPESFNSCSHGAGRKMSRTEAKRTFSVEEHVKATEGVSCRKDASVIDETPGAYKDIDAVMDAQADLVEIVHTLRQVICVKG